MPISKEQSILGGLGIRPTDLSSRQLREHPAWTQRVKDEALFSARTTSERYLAMLKEKLQAVASRDTTPQKAVEQLQQALSNIGYTPQAGFPGSKSVPPAVPMSMEDLSSSRRINLILDTNIKKARSLGQMAASEDPVFLIANPAWRLTRTGARKKPRGDWRERWAKAGASVAWKGASKKEMVALKDSPIWEALGKGVGGYDDTVGSPFPPFAFGSGLAWVNVGRREWERICKSEGMPLEQPKAPAHSSAGTVPKTEEEQKEASIQKRDIPDYAQSPEFQKRLREALGQFKKSRAEKSAKGEIFRTDKPNLPSFGDYAGNIVYRSTEKVFGYYEQIQRRTDFLANIKLKYYEKCLSNIEESQRKMPNSNLGEQIERVREAIGTLSRDINSLRLKEGIVRKYLDRLKGEHGKVNDDMARLYENSAGRMATIAESIYDREKDRTLKTLLEGIADPEKIRKELFEKTLRRWTAVTKWFADDWNGLTKKFYAAGGKLGTPIAKEYKEALDEAVDLYDKVFDIPLDDSASVAEMDGWNKLMDRFESAKKALEKVYAEFSEEIERLENAVEPDSSNQDWSKGIPSTKVVIPEKTEEQRRQIQSIVNALPARIQSYHAKTYDQADKAIIATISSKRVAVVADLSNTKAYCTGSGVVHLARKTSEWGNTPDTLMHETGHSVLDKAGQRSLEEIKPKFLPIWETVKKEAEEFCRKAYGDGWDKATKRRAQSDWYKEIANKVFGIDYATYSVLPIENKSAMSDVCDLLCSAFLGKRFWGHSVQYYGKGPARGLHEVVANCTAILSNKTLLEKGRTIFPKTLALVEEIVYGKKTEN